MTLLKPYVVNVKQKKQMLKLAKKQHRTQNEGAWTNEQNIS